MSSVLEKELTCSICTDILFDPVTYLDCLHTNCGSCSKSWFTSRAVPTCPSCRETVRIVKQNSSINTLLEDFLNTNPEKKRSDEDVKQCREIYKPGDVILGALSAGGGGGGGGGNYDRSLNLGSFIAASSAAEVAENPFMSAAASRAAIQQVNAQTEAMRQVMEAFSSRGRSPPTEPSAMRMSPFRPPFAEVGRRPGRALSVLSNHSQHSRRNSTASAGLSREGSPTWSRSSGFDEFPSLADFSDALPGSRPPIVSSRYEPLLNHMMNSAFGLNQPSPPSSPRGVLGEDAPKTIAELLLQGNESITISCDGCTNDIDFELHYECSQCTMYHLCASCHRSNKQCPSANLGDRSHILIPQKLLQNDPTRGFGSRPVLQAGVFCSICESWCDEDRADRTSAPDSFFWHCETCNDGHWVYCQRCVRRGQSCSHQITLWTNSRPHQAPSPSTVSYGPSRNTIIRSLPRSILPGNQWLIHRGYTRWPGYTLTCDLCTTTIRTSRNGWRHCIHPSCNDGSWDVCSSCERTLTVTSPSGTLHPRILCLSGHELATLALEPSVGIPPENVGMVMKQISMPKIERPDMVAGGEARRGGVVAVRGVWDGEREGGRRWGGGMQLCFPKGARLEDVVCAFVEEGSESWWWGTYAGVGGIFEGGNVRFS